MTALRRLPAIAAVLLLLGLCRMPGAAAAEEQTIRAFSTFDIRGELTKTGENDATFIGLLSGRFYIDTEQGPVDAGSITCPVVVHVNLKNSTQQGNGQCVFIGAKGNKAYMDLTCTGVPLVGCGGESTLTGGTGPLAGVSGGGRFMLRSSLQDLSPSSGAAFQDTARGIIFWQALHYKIP
jgi:hypothetical protein